MRGGGTNQPHRWLVIRIHVSALRPMDLLIISRSYHIILTIYTGPAPCHHVQPADDRYRLVVLTVGVREINAMVFHHFSVALNNISGVMSLWLILSTMTLHRLQQTEQSHSPNLITWQLIEKKLLLAHLSRRLKWGVVIVIRPLSVCRFTCLFTCHISERILANCDQF